MKSKLAAILTLIALVGLRPAWSCTIFVLTDGRHALFCNNEDYTDSNTYIWFVPGLRGCLGCAFVGYEDGWEQGGVNTAGLAYDWVAGPSNRGWKPDPLQKVCQGNVSALMLKSCKTTEEAIAFYKSHSDPSLASAAILIADRTGRSVEIRVERGQLKFLRSQSCRGFGYGRKVLLKELPSSPQPTEANGRKILRACRQAGKYPTQYSNIFDLRTGEIWVYQFDKREGGVHLQMQDELTKGPHCYHIPNLRQERAQKIHPLLVSMRKS